MSSSMGALHPGSLLADRYRILSEIGQGGFATVYKAQDLDRRKVVAIKQITLSQLSPQEMIEVTDSYNREIIYLSRLRHEHLPLIYDHFTDPENWYVVMDYIEGETLDELLTKIRHGRFPVAKVLAIGIALCKVLQYLHTRSPAIIFRDVKPANIMMNREGRLYLIDFGIARQYRPEQAKDTGPLGSPGYAAPEQYGKAQSTVQTDIYGLGATLQTLLTGKDPLELSLAGALAGHKIPKKLQRLLDRMLERDSTQRPKTMREVHMRLERIKLGIKGLAARFSLGLLIGSLPGPLLVMLLLLTSLNVAGLGNWLEGIALALYCTWPLAFLAQLTTGIVFLCLASRRIVGLGILIMLALYILDLFVRWIPLGMPGFGY